MSRRVQVAVALQVALILIGMASPLAIRFTGQTIYLETLRVDPRALLRGDYVILNYQIQQDVQEQELASRSVPGTPVYVTVTTDRPASFVSAGLERPSLQPGQACLTGRSRGRAFGRAFVFFPQIAQYFVSEGRGRDIEGSLGEDLLAVVKVSSRCNAVLIDLEPR